MARPWESWRSSWSKPGGWVGTGAGVSGEPQGGKGGCWVEEACLAGPRPARLSSQVFMSLIHLFKKNNSIYLLLAVLGLKVARAFL